MHLGNEFSYWSLAKGVQGSNDQVTRQVMKSFATYQGKYLSNVSSGQLADGLDEFYKDFRNRSIDVSDAVWPVLRQIAGDPATAIDPLVANLRRNAQRN